MPQGIIYQSYMAGTKEPRFASYFNQNTNGAVANKTAFEDFTGTMHDMWDVALGARVGIVRYGNDDPNWPEGWQLDMEGGVFPRLSPTGYSTPLISDDFRFGIPLTYGGDKWEFKMGYYHISAHLGDEYLLYVNPSAVRINYVRDSAILGAGYFVQPELRLYGEIGVAAVDGGAEASGAAIRRRMGSGTKYRIVGRPFRGGEWRLASGSQIRRERNCPIRLDVAKVRPRFKLSYRWAVLLRQE